MAHDKQIVDETTPADPDQVAPAHKKDTAEAMEARREAVVDASFPASWSKSPAAAKKHSKNAAPKQHTWATYRQNKMNQYQADRKKEKLIASEMQIKEEHQTADQEAQKEISHLSMISNEVKRPGPLQCIELDAGQQPLQNAVLPLVRLVCDTLGFCHVSKAGPRSARPI